MLSTLLIEDNLSCEALKIAESIGEVEVVAAYDGRSGADYRLSGQPENVLMDVALAGDERSRQPWRSGEFPRLPVVFYLIADDDDYHVPAVRILSHYAYVRKSNYLLPEMIVPLLRDAVQGRSLVDPDIELRVQEVRHRDEHAPMALLEPNEQVVARMLAEGLTNEQIAARLGFQDKRTISRTNARFTRWGLVENTTDEKIARTRAALIVVTGRLIQ
jgi:DNA-binding NarL/FixJ family response regulator